MSPLMVRTWTLSWVPVSGAASPTARSELVVPENVLRSIHTAVPATTPTTTSPDAELTFTVPWWTAPMWMSPEAVLALTEAPAVWISTSPLAEVVDTSPPADPMVTVPEALWARTPPPARPTRTLPEAVLTLTSPEASSTYMSPEAPLTLAVPYRPRAVTSAEATLTLRLLPVGIRMVA